MFEKMFSQETCSKGFVGASIEDASMVILLDKKFIGMRKDRPVDFQRECASAYAPSIMYGGYLENRMTFLFETYLNGPNMSFIHLGVDIWVPHGTAVMSTRDMEVIGTFVDKDQEGGWGTVVIARSLESHMLDKIFLFAHLKFNARQPRVEELLDGEVIGVVGGSGENGGWHPHLHIQCVNLGSPMAEKIGLSNKLFRRGGIKDFMSSIDGYATDRGILNSELAEFCPDPIPLLF
jgi:hypothetical protein